MSIVQWPLQWLLAWLKARVVPKVRTAHGGGSIGPILWIVLAVIIIGAVIAWWETGGSADLSTVLGNFTKLLSGADTATAA